MPRGPMLADLLLRHVPLGEPAAVHIARQLVKSLLRGDPTTPWQTYTGHRGLIGHFCCAEPHTGDLARGRIGLPCVDDQSQPVRPTRSELQIVARERGTHAYPLVVLEEPSEAAGDVSTVHP